MIDVIAGVLLLVGSTFSLVAAIGLLRFPDVYVRMQVGAKAGTLGAGLVLVAIAVEAQDLEVGTRALAGLVFLLFTSPIAAHLLARAGYRAGTPLWERTLRDDLARAPTDQVAARPSREPAAPGQRDGG